MTEVGTGRWQAPLALLLGVALASLPGALFSMLLFQHMQRLALPAQTIALFHPPYAIGLLVAALPAAAAAARFGARCSFLVAVVLVAALSIAAALPLEQGPLIGLRLLQGAASAGLLAAGLALVRPVFGEAQLGLGFGLVTLAGVLGVTLLPVLSGFGMGFGVPGLVLPGLLLALCTLLLGLKALPADQVARPFDVLGALLNLACLGLLLGALYTAPFRPFRGFVLLVLGLLVLALWVWQQQRRSDPMLPLDLLTHPEDCRAAAATLLGSLALAAVGTAATPHLAGAWRIPAQALGALFLAAAAATALAALAGGLLLQGRPAWPPARPGALLLALGAAMLLFPWGGMPAALLAMLLLGTGRGLFETGNAMALVGHAPGGREAAAAGLLVAAGGLGGVLAPFVVFLVPLFWLGGKMRDGAAGSPLPIGLGLVAVTALLAAWFSLRERRPRGAAPAVGGPPGDMSP
ncbi:MFS transporter [Roseomonas sp. WA12]